MAIYLGHTTARRILESRLALRLEPMPHHAMHAADVGKREVTATIRAAFDKAEVAMPLAKNFFCRPREPLDVMVESRAACHNWVGGRSHLVTNALPSGSFTQLEMGIYVASPALCLVQLAPTISRFGLIQLAMSFCGIYQLEGDRHRMPYERRPITTLEEIGDYLDRAKGMRGVNSVREALRWVVPNSGSPMETRMALSLYLSGHLGGYGLPRPLMNEPIQLSEAAKRICSQSLCYGDAVWRVAGHVPFDMEYQSLEHHDRAAKYGEDYARQLAIQSMGYDVQFVTKQQLDDHYQLDELARMVAAHTGAHLDPNAFAWPEWRTRMHDDLMATF